MLAAALNKYCGEVDELLMGEWSGEKSVRLGFLTRELKELCAPESVKIAGFNTLHQDPLTIRATVSFKLPDGSVVIESGVGSSRKALPAAIAEARHLAVKDAREHVRSRKRVLLQPPVVTVKRALTEDEMIDRVCALYDK